MIFIRIGKRHVHARDSGDTLLQSCVLQVSRMRDDLLYLLALVVQRVGTTIQRITQQVLISLIQW